MRASVPVTKTHTGTLAHSTESDTYGVGRIFSVPLVLSVPPMRPTTTVRHGQKQRVSRARAGYQRANEEAARIIAADPLRYPGLPQIWVALTIEKQQPAIRGPLFGKAAA